MQEIKVQLKEKVARLRAAINLESHDCVPVVGQADFWPITYSKKYNMQQAFYSADILGECYREAFSQWHDWDAFDTIMYSLGPFLDATGSKRFNVPGRDISPDAEFQHPDLCLMEADEYPELIRDPVKFQLEKVIPRLCKRIGSDDSSVRFKAVSKAAFILGQWIAKARHYSSVWPNEYGIPPVLKGSAVYMPFDFIADKLRGFYNGLIDVKERTKEIQAASEALVPFFLNVALPPGLPEDDYPLLFNPQHASPFLSPKDYEKVYWPTFKKMIDLFTERGHRVWVFFENNQEQHLERLQDLPKGKIVAHLEATDLTKAKKALGGRNCIAGGMPARLLVRGTQDEVREQTRSVLKIFEDEPGFIMTCDATIPVGAKAENIKAWLDAVKDFGHIGGRVPSKGLDEKERVGRGTAGGDAKRTGSTFSDLGRNLFTPWEAVVAEFGEVKGDEGIIKENWESFEMQLLLFIYWLVK